MKKKLETPVLTTHVANIAFNKAIAIHFLLSEAQDTHGLHSYSLESYVNDKLQVVLWMIYRFTGLSNEDSAKPWVELPEWKMPTDSMAGIDRMHEFESLLKNIQKEANNAGDLWDKENQQAVLFLKKMIAQVNECIWYTNQRLTAILVCLKMGPMGDDPEALFSAGPAMAEKIMSNPMATMGGYLIVKNEFNSKKILAIELLNIIIGFLVDKAVREGYAKPVE